MCGENATYLKKNEFAKEYQQGNKGTHQKWAK